MIEVHPISTKKEAKFRGPTSSKDFNEWIEENYYDLVQLFSLSSSNSKDIVSDLSMLIEENSSLSRKVAQLEQTLESINKSLSSLSENPTTASKVLSKTFTSNDRVVEDYPFTGEKKCEINTEFGVAHMPLHQPPVSKVYLKNSAGEVFIPSTLKVDLYESTNIINIGESVMPQDKLVDDSNIINAFDGDSTTYWQRSIEADSSIDKVYAAIDIELPQNIINHLRVNNINLVPAPEFGFTILDIKYLRSGEWNTIPTFPKTSVGAPKAIVDAGKQFILFNEQEATKIRILIVQDNWKLKDGSRVFTYGFKQIGVFFTKFTEGQSSMMVRFDVPSGETHSFESITSVESVLVEGGIKGQNSISTKIYLDGEGLNEYAIGTTLPALTKSVYVEVTIKSQGNTSPALSQLNILYTTS